MKYHAVVLDALPSLAPNKRVHADRIGRRCQLHMRGCPFNDGLDAYPSWCAKWARLSYTPLIRMNAVWTLGPSHASSACNSALTRIDAMYAHAHKSSWQAIATLDA